jgi:hypothetical protein
MEQTIEAVNHVIRSRRSIQPQSYIQKKIPDEIVAVCRLQRRKSETACRLLFGKIPYGNCARIFLSGKI